MDRRRLFAFAGAAIAAAVLPAAGNAAMLETARAKLLPGLWSVFGGTDIAADIRIENGGLLVVAATDAHSLGFFISEISVRDGRHLVQFTETLPLLRRCMENAACALQ